MKKGIPPPPSGNRRKAPQPPKPNLSKINIPEVPQTENIPSVTVED